MSPGFHLEDGLGHWAARFSWAARNALERRLKPLKLSPPMMAALLALAGGSERAADLAKVMGVDAAAVTRLLDRLCDEGWVSRCELEGDRRSRRIALSEKAAKLVPSLRKLAQEMDGLLGKSLSKAEREGLIGLLRKLAGHAEKL